MLSHSLSRLYVILQVRGERQEPRGEAPRLVIVLQEERAHGRKIVTISI